MWALAPTVPPDPSSAPTRPAIVCTLAAVIRGTATGRLARETLHPTNARLWSRLCRRLFTQHLGRVPDPSPDRRTCVLTTYDTRVDTSRGCPVIS